MNRHTMHPQTALKSAENMGISARSDGLAIWPPRLASGDQAANIALQHRHCVHAGIHALIDNFSMVTHSLQ